MNIIVLTRQVKAADEVKCDFTGIEAAVRFKEQVKAKTPAAECQISVLVPVSYTHLRAHETGRNLVCRLLLEKKKIEKIR